MKGINAAAEPRNEKQTPPPPPPKKKTQKRRRARVLVCKQFRRARVYSFLQLLGFMLRSITFQSGKRKTRNISSFVVPSQTVFFFSSSFSTLVFFFFLFFSSSFCTLFFPIFFLHFVYRFSFVSYKMFSVTVFTLI